MAKEREPTDSAFRHVLSEFGLENVELSLRMESSVLHRAHDAIHEFMLLAALLAPSETGERPSWDWQSKSAFLLCQWEVFNHAHRSFCEALCTYYNVAFALLRVTCELLIKGVFWECMSHKGYRDNSAGLDNAGSKLKQYLAQVFGSSPAVETQLERTSAAIYNILAPVMDDRNFVPSMRAMIQQLDDWGMFDPVPRAETTVYKEIYSKLSADVHVVPDRIDIGRRIISETPDIFEQRVLPEALGEYAATLNRLMDLAVVIELNVMQSLVAEYDESRDNLRKRLDTLTSLQLEDSATRAKQLVASTT
jgi:hypothetical protein